MALTAKQERPTGPYVYALLDHEGAIFYVGKGRGSRIFAHVRHARTGGAGPKCDRIRSIWAAGWEVGHQVLSEHETDEAAYAEENRLIDTLPGLTNIAGKRRPHGLRSVVEAELRKVIRLGRRIKPFVQWLHEQPRSTQQIVWYRQIVDEIRTTERILTARLGGVPADV